tara:strand:- start:1079 stop:1714 length:636 start_codon:yes stop_codon:yes gene_type:complete
VFRVRDKTYIEKKLMLSDYGFHQPYPPRRINSLYFDSSDFVNIRESIEGCSKRTKKRLRWYENNGTQHEANLEFKSKQGHLSWKKIFPKFCIIYPSASKWDEFVDKGNWERLQVIGPIFPSSIVSYSRTYYESANKKIRITLDQDIVYYDQHLSSGPNFLNNYQDPAKLVIEIKLNSRDQGLIKKVQHFIPFCSRRFSKYCESMSSHNLHS